MNEVWFDAGAIEAQLRERGVISGDDHVYRIDEVSPTGPMIITYTDKLGSVHTKEAPRWDIVIARECGEVN